jgi:hypothetical protein
MLELHIFDFDGTLFNSPTDTAENHQKYEQLTGIPWLISEEKSVELTQKYGKTITPRTGWWGKPETLEPPLVPDPAPIDWFNKEVVDDLNKSKNNPKALTLILTGRHSGLKKQVIRICKDGNLLDGIVQVYCMGEKGPSPQGKIPNKTLPWKLWIVEQHLRLNPLVSKIIFWEDRDDHVNHFNSLKDSMSQEIIVNHIKNQAMYCINY